MSRNSTTRGQRQTQVPPSQEPQMLPESGKPSETASGCLLRFYWMFVGHAAAFFAAYGIVQAEGMVSASDVLFWLFVASLVLVRYADIRRFDGRTAEGRPATIRDGHRFALQVLGAFAIVWAASHGLNYFLR